MDYLRMLNNMEDRIYLSNLYDYYQGLLTEKQQGYFEDYYFNNLSLQEIAENYEVSRNAIHKQIKEGTEKLLFYEKKLQLYENGRKIKQLLEPVDKKIKEAIEELI